MAHIHPRYTTKLIKMYKAQERYQEIADKCGGTRYYVKQIVEGLIKSGRLQRRAILPRGSQEGPRSPELKAWFKEHVPRNEANQVRWLKALREKVLAKPGLVTEIALAHGCNTSAVSNALSDRGIGSYPSNTSWPIVHRAWVMTQDAPNKDRRTEPVEKRTALKPRRLRRKFSDRRGVERRSSIAP